MRITNNAVDADITSSQQKFIIRKNSKLPTRGLFLFTTSPLQPVPAR